MSEKVSENKELGKKANDGDAPETLTRKRNINERETEAEDESPVEDGKEPEVKKAKLVQETKPIDSKGVSEGGEKNGEAQTKTTSEIAIEGAKPEQTKTTTTTTETSTKDPKQDTESTEKKKDTETKLSAKQEEEGSGEKKSNATFGGSGFGSTAFGSSFKASSVSPFSSSLNTPTSSSPGLSSGFVFGLGSKFSNAFKNATSRKSIFDTASNDTSKTKEEEAKAKSPEADKKKGDEGIASSADLYKTVKLEKKDVKSGEEEETAVFQCKAKVYVLNLNDINSGWKERGLGMLHINKLSEDKVHANKAKARIVMRTIGILKVILNVPIGSGFEVFKGMESSLHSEKFIRLNYIETDGDATATAQESDKDNKNGLAKNQKFVQYAIRVGSADSANELYDCINGFIPRKKGSVESNV